jgi:acyl-CoA synthetase (AMP-forming)/AMP-acid ligase II
MFEQVLPNLNYSDEEANNIAIIDFSERPRRILSFKEIQRYTVAIAKMLTDMGYKRGDKISIIGLNSFKYVAVYLGIRLAGMTPVVINHKLSGQQIHYVITHSETRFVFHDEEFLSLLPKNVATANLNTLDKWLILSDSEFEFIDDPNQTALMLYTSGSTGTPKCISVTAKSRQWSIKVMPEYAQRARTIVAQPLSHINALNSVDIIIRNKSPLVLLPKFTVELYKYAILKTNVARIPAIPSMLAMLLQNDSNVEEMKSSNVKRIMLSGAPTSEKLYDRIQEAFPNAVISITFGMSESGPGVFDNLGEMPRMSVGRAKEGNEYKLIDDVLWIKTPGLFSGYYKDGDKTNESYDSDGFFNTRDKFRVDENGFYYFIGRADDMFVSGGENIYPGEVEETLNNHPHIIDSCVIGLDDDIKGTKAYAFVLMDKDVPENEIQDWYAQNGPAYQIPRRIWKLDEFPVTFINKIDRKALTELGKKLLDESDS